MSTTGTSGVKGKGKKKIEIKRIIKESNRQVTFSKRHKGLFKKASELVTLCGVELALIIFSPSGKPFSFGHPSVEDVIPRYLFQAPPLTSETMRYIQAQRDAKVRELNVQLSSINNQLDASKKHVEELKRLHKEAQAQFWWAIPVEDMDKPQLEKFRAALDEVKERVTSYAAADVTNPPPHQISYDVGGPSNVTSYAAADVTNPPPHHIFYDVGGPSNVMVPVHHPLDEVKERVTSYAAVDVTNLPPHHIFYDVGGPSNVMVPVHHPLDEVKERVSSYAAADVTNPPPHQIFDDVGGPSNVMVPVHHPPLPPHQAFQQQFFFEPMPQAHHLFGFNNMGGYGGPPGFF